MAETLSVEQFELVFQGPKDDSPRTLQRIKGVFVADLEFPIPDVQRFLESPPITIKSATNEKDLHEAYKLLKAAGAKVLIVKPKETAPAQDSPAEHDETPAGSTLEFELTLDDLAQDTSKKAQSNPKVYTLNLEDNDAPLAKFIQPDEEPVQDEPQPSTPEDSPQEATPPNPLLGLLKETPEPSPDEPTLSLATPEIPAEEAPSEPSPPQPLSTLDSGAMLEFELEEPSTQPGQTNAAPNTAQEPSISPDSTESPADPLAGLSLDLASEPQETHTPSAAAKLAEELIKDEEIPDLEPSPDPPTIPSDEPLESALGLAERDELLGLEEDISPPPKAMPPPPEKPTLAPQPPAMNLETEIESPRQTATAGAQISSSPPPEIVPGRESADAASPPVIFTEGAPAKPSTTKKKASIPLDVAIPIIIGTGIIGLANIYYFSPNLAPTSDLDALLEQATAANEGATSAIATPLPPPITFTGNILQPDYQITLTFKLDDGKPVWPRLHVITPEPPAPTKEDLVNGKSRAPWLRRIEAHDIVIKDAGNNEYSAHGLVLGYVEHQGAQLRIPGTVELRMVMNESPSATVQITSKNADFEPAREYVFLQDDSGRFHFQVSGTVNLSKDGPT